MKRCGRSRWFIFGSLLCTIAISSGVPAPAAPAAGLAGEYKIGVLEPLTGPLAVEGKRHLVGYEVMRDIINDHGGVMGKKLVLVPADAPDPTAAANEANRLISGGLRILTGTYSSTLCGAASEVAARNSVIYWETSCVDPRYAQRGLRNVYRTESDANGFGQYMVEFTAAYLVPALHKKNAGLRVSFLSEDSSYGQGVTEAARRRAKELGMQEVSLDYYAALSTNDFTPTILKLKQTSPDIIMAIARGNDGVVFWKQAREQNLRVSALVSAGAAGYGSPDFGKALRNDANGVFALLDEPSECFNIGAMSPKGRQLEREWRQRLISRAGAIYGGHQLAGGGLWMLKIVLDKAGTDNPDRFRQAALSLDLPPGSLINGWGLKFLDNGQNSLDHVQHYILQWQHEKMVTIWPPNYTTCRIMWVPLPDWSHRI